MDLADQTILTMGYGSGDAAEAIPMQVVEGWEEAAAKIGVDSALAGAVLLTREQYERRHDGLAVELSYEPQGFIGSRLREALLAAARLSEHSRRAAAGATPGAPPF